MGIRLTRLILQIALVCALTALSANAPAWERPINTYLVDLTDLGLAPSIHQHSDDFKNGNDEPLRERKARPWTMPPDLDTVAHLADSAFQAALASRDQAEAARCLGRAAYYLQDMADPTRDLKALKNSPHGEEIRLLAERLVIQLIHERQIKQEESAYWGQVRKLNRRLAGAAWPALVNTTRAAALQTAAGILDSLRIAGPDRENEIRSHLEGAFSGLPAAGEGVAIQPAGAAPAGRVRLEVWDASCEDGDRINLSINGTLRLADQTLAKKKTILTLDLPRGSNTLEILALSSGSDCPAKPKPRTHASVAVRITGGGLQLHKTWLIREGERVSERFVLK
ncbi:MAG: hypothetical protein P8X55_01090 [Desulfosarcinaceae bacterium]